MKGDFMNELFNGFVYGLAIYAVLDIIVSVVLYRKNPRLSIDVANTFRSLFDKKPTKSHDSWDECCKDCGECDGEGCDWENCDCGDCYLCDDGNYAEDLESDNEHIRELIKESDRADQEADCILSGTSYSDEDKAQAEAAYQKIMSQIGAEACDGIYNKESSQCQDCVCAIQCRVRS
jgi:hypothetical protein